MLKLLRYFLLAALPLAFACQKDADLNPATYDVLALATGHWEWDNSAYMGGIQTPATLGYTRQAVFEAGGQLVVRRRGQADYRTSYQFSLGSPQPCATPVPVPLITFANEPGLGNTNVKLYLLSQRGGQQVLTLTSEGMCLDGGAIETYHWVAE